MEELTSINQLLEQKAGLTPERTAEISTQAELVRTTLAERNIIPYVYREALYYASLFISLTEIELYILSQGLFEQTLDEVRNEFNGDAVPCAGIALEKFLGPKLFRIFRMELSQEIPPQQVEIFTVGLAGCNNFEDIENLFKDRRFGLTPKILTRYIHTGTVYKLLPGEGDFTMTRDLAALFMFSRAFLEASPSALRIPRLYERTYIHWATLLGLMDLIRSSHIEWDLGLEPEPITVLCIYLLATESCIRLDSYYEKSSEIRSLAFDITKAKPLSELTKSPEIDIDHLSELQSEALLALNIFAHFANASGYLFYHLLPVSFSDIVQLSNRIYSLAERILMPEFHASYLAHVVTTMSKGLTGENANDWETEMEELNTNAVRARGEIIGHINSVLKPLFELNFNPVEETPDRGLKTIYSTLYKLAGNRPWERYGPRQILTPEVANGILSEQGDYFQRDDRYEGQYLADLITQGGILSASCQRFSFLEKGQIAPWVYTMLDHLNAQENIKVIFADRSHLYRKDFPFLQLVVLYTDLTSGISFPMEFRLYRGEYQELIEITHFLSKLWDTSIWAQVDRVRAGIQPLVAKSRGDDSKHTRSVSLKTTVKQNQVEERRVLIPGHHGVKLRTKGPPLLAVLVCAGQDYQDYAQRLLSTNPPLRVLEGDHSEEEYQWNLRLIEENQIRWDGIAKQIALKILEATKSRKTNTEAMVAKLKLLLSARTKLEVAQFTPPNCRLFVYRHLLGQGLSPIEIQVALFAAAGEISNVQLARLVIEESLTSAGLDTLHKRVETQLLELFISPEFCVPLGFLKDIARADLLAPLFNGLRSRIEP